MAYFCLFISASCCSGPSQTNALFVKQGDLGFLYLDLYSRKGKFPNCAHFSIRGGRRLSETEYQLPVWPLNYFNFAMYCIWKVSCFILLCAQDRLLFFFFFAIGASTWLKLEVYLISYFKFFLAYAFHPSTFCRE